MIDRYSYSDAKIGIILALLLSLAPIACGQVSKPADTANQPQPAPSSAPEVAGTAAPESTSGVAPAICGVEQTCVAQVNPEPVASQLESDKDIAAQLKLNETQVAERAEILAFAKAKTEGESKNIGLGLDEADAEKFVSQAAGNFGSFVEYRTAFRSAYDTYARNKVPFDRDKSLAFATKMASLSQPQTLALGEEPMTAEKLIELFNADVANEKAKIDAAIDSGRAAADGVMRAVGGPGLVAPPLSPEAPAPVEPQTQPKPGPSTELPGHETPADPMHDSDIGPQ